MEPELERMFRTPCGLVHLGIRWRTGVPKETRCESRANIVYWEESELVPTLHVPTCLHCLGAP